MSPLPGSSTEHLRVHSRHTGDAGLGNDQVKIPSAGRHRPAPGVRPSVTEWPVSASPAPGLLATAPGSCHWAQCRHPLLPLGQAEATPAAQQGQGGQQRPACPRTDTGKAGGCAPRTGRMGHGSRRHSATPPAYAQIAAHPKAKPPPSFSLRPSTAAHARTNTRALHAQPAQTRHCRSILGTCGPLRDPIQLVHLPPPQGPLPGAGWGRNTETQKNQTHQVLPKLRNHETAPRHGRPWPEGRKKHSLSQQPIHTEAGFQALHANCCAVAQVWAAPSAPGVFTKPPLCRKSCSGRAVGMLPPYKRYSAHNRT